MVETDRAVVKTYVPRYQKDIWAAEAEKKGMSQSEFVRAMVQAGRNGFESGSGDATPGDDGLETVIEAALAEGPLSFEALVDEVAAELETTLEAMQTDGELRYVPGEGYVLE